MPHLRFNRDKRGYENTFVVHTARRRGKSRSRILYWFRTPPGVRVGRSALDEDAIRLLEEHHPDVEFDWTRILKSPPETTPEPPPPLQRARTGRRAEETQRRDARVQPPPVEASEPEPVSLPDPEELEPADLAGDSIVAVTPSAAVTRLGAEGLLRLRGRYAELMTRITQRIADPAQQEQLKSTAERLNPDTWVTDQEVSQGLDAYEATFEEIRAVVGRPRKRRRRRRGARGEEPAATRDSSTTTENAGTFEIGDEAEPPDPAEDEDA